MGVAVVIPWHPGHASRQAAFEYVHAWWSDLGFEPHVAPGSEPWSKGAAVDSAVRSLGTETSVLIVADADVVVDPAGIAAALRGVLDGYVPWAQPHGWVIRLPVRASRDVIGGADPHKMARRFARTSYGPPGGGIVVVDRDAYETVGGIDPRFVGWGGEDISFARALDTLCGPGSRANFDMIHLWHPRQARRPGNRAFEESELLANRYLDAEGDRAAMQSLVNEHCASCAEQSA